MLVGILLTLAVIGRAVDWLTATGTAPMTAETGVTALSSAESSLRLVARRDIDPEIPPKHVESLAASKESKATPPAPAIIAGVHGASVRTAPSTDYERIGYLEPGAEASVTGWYGSWWQIDYGGEPAWVFGNIVTARNIEHGVPEVEPPDPPIIPPPTQVPTQNSAVGIGRWIDVDLSEQVLTAYEDTTPVRSTNVSSGLPLTPTPVGQFRIWVKFSADDMEGPDYYLPDVPYVMYFHRGYGLHGTYWHNNFGQPMSHGCVNLPTSEAEWLFDWSEVGTLVSIHE